MPSRSLVLGSAPIGAFSCLAIALGCAGGGALDPTADWTASPVDFAGSASRGFPVAEPFGTPLAAVDEDPGTHWSADANEIGTFYAWRGLAQGVRVQTDAEAVWVRPLWVTARTPPSVKEAGDWVRVVAVDSQVRHAFDRSAHGVELRLDEAGFVAHVELVHPAPAPARALDRAQLRTAVYGSGAVAFEAKTARFAEVKLGEVCGLSGPEPEPGAVFSGTCAGSAEALVVDGEVPGLGAVRETLAVATFGPCLTLIGGFPYVSCAPP